MRKYILATTLIILGVLIFAYDYMENSQNNYSDKLFATEAKAFDDNFNAFVNEIEKNIKDLQVKIPKEDLLKDTVFIKDYLFNFMEKDPYLISTALIKNTTKLGIKKDGKSIVVAIDSTKILDVVRWQRYENNKLIGIWHESFEEEVYKTKWFNDLKKKS